MNTHTTQKVVTVLTALTLLLGVSACSSSTTAAITPQSTTSTKPNKTETKKQDEKTDDSEKTKEPSNHEKNKAIKQLAKTLVGDNCADAVKQLKDRGILGDVTSAGEKLTEDEINDKAYECTVSFTNKHTLTSHTLDLSVSRSKKETKEER